VAEPTIWQKVFVGATTAVVVMAIGWLAGAVSNLRDSAIRHELLIEQFVEFKDAGKRYSREDADRDIRTVTTQVDNLRAEVRNLTSNQIRYWAAFRDHTVLPGHSGAEYRLKLHDEQLRELNDRTKHKTN